MKITLLSFLFGVPLLAALAGFFLFRSRFPGLAPYAALAAFLAAGALSAALVFTDETEALVARLLPPTLEVVVPATVIGMATVELDPASEPLRLTWARTQRIELDKGGRARVGYFPGAHAHFDRIRWRFVTPAGDTASVARDSRAVRKENEIVVLRFFVGSEEAFQRSVAPK